MNIKRVLRFILVALVITTLVYLYKSYGMSEYLNKESLLAYLEPFGNFIPVVYILVFIFAMLINIPASIFMISIGTLCGPFWGSIWAITGCYLASFILFALARKINYDKIKTKLGSRWDTFDKQIESNGFLYLTFIRSLSLFPFSVICYASGVTSIKVKDYVRATVAGCIPQIMIFCYIIPTLLTEPKLSLENLLPVLLLIGIWLTLFATFFISDKLEKNKLSVLEMNPV
jgi:uncharacterized membrane protein YdjX (TVP38/TMEM64 family)